MTLNLPVDVVLGVTHVLVNGELIRLYHCPFCSFKNIHEDEITHHIRYRENSIHDVDVDKLDKNRYVTSISKSRYHYEKKEDLSLPEIQCPWCDYKDKVERDLEWHILESPQCKTRLYKMKVPDDEYSVQSYAWSHSDIESRLARAVRLAKRKTIAK